MTSGAEAGKAPRMGRWIVTGIAFCAVLIAGFLVSYFNYTSVDYTALTEGDWKTVQVGVPFVQFETPVPLEDKSRPPIGPEREFIKRSQSFVYENGFDLRVMASVVEYLPHVYMDPGNVVLSVQNFDKQFGASNIKYQPVELIIGSYKAWRVDGSFTIGGKDYIFSRVNAEYRNIYRDLLVIVRANDDDALRVRNRMVGTIYFEPQ